MISPNLKQTLWFILPAFIVAFESSPPTTRFNLPWLTNLYFLYFIFCLLAFHVHASWQAPTEGCIFLCQTSCCYRNTILIKTSSLIMSAWQSEHSVFHEHYLIRKCTLFSTGHKIYTEPYNTDVRDLNFSYNAKTRSEFFFPSQRRLGVLLFLVRQSCRLNHGSYRYETCSLCSTRRIEQHPSNHLE